MFTTHDLGAAWEICDRVVVMYAGQTAEVAPREAFFAQPRHPYTRMLLDSLPEPGRDPVGIPGAVPSPLTRRRLPLQPALPTRYRDLPREAARSGGT